MLFMDSTIIREIPPLHYAWAPLGTQTEVPLIGSHAKRVLSTVLNIRTGDQVSHVTKCFYQTDFQDLLHLTRSHWRGWNIVLFIDRASPHTAYASVALAQSLSIELRWLPTACPELNVVDCLWRHVKYEVLANEPTPSLTVTVRRAVDYIADLTPHQRLQKAGVFSDDFWLAALL
jgi:transposase